MHSRLPLIGGWLRRRSLQALAENGTDEALYALAEAAESASDEQIRCGALQALQRRDGEEAADGLCRVWAATRNSVLARLVLERKLVASRPPEVKVLSALCVDRLEEIRKDEIGLFATLINVAHDSDGALANKSLSLITDILNTPRDRASFEALADQLCEEWGKTRSPHLEALMLKGRYVASQPLRLRVLSALKTGQRQLLSGVGAEGVALLLAACRDRDGLIAEQARLALSHLKKAEARDEICRLALDNGNTLAREAAIKGKYAPQDEHQRALFFFLTEQWERYDALDFDRRLLLAVYESAGPALRKRIVDKLRVSGRTDFLAVIAGHDFRRKSGGMTPDEIKLLLQMLESNSEWRKLWSLVFELPFVWSVSVVQSLARSAWRPEAEDERHVFERLAALASAEMASSEKELSEVLPPTVMRSRARVFGRVNSVAFSPVRPVIAIGTGDRKAGLWNFQHNKIETCWRGFGHSLGKVSFMPNGTLVCAERTNGMAHCGIYFCRGDEISRLAQHTGSVTGVEAISERHAISVGRDQIAVLWDIEEGRMLGRHRLDVTSDDWARGICVSHQSGEVALLHNGVTILQVPQLQKAAGVEWLSGVARCAAFAPDHDSLILGKVNGQVLVYRRQGNKLQPERQPIFHHSKEVKGVEVLARRGIVVTAGGEGVVQFISWANRAVVGRVQVPCEKLTSLHISPDGDFMAVGDSDASVSLWDLRVMDVPMLFAMPFAKAAPVQLAAVTAAAAEPTLHQRARRALQYMECVLQHRFRYDIEIDEVWAIKAGEFDIEIEG